MATNNTVTVEYIRHLRVPAVGGEQYKRPRTKAIHGLSGVVFYNKVVNCKGPSEKCCLQFEFLLQRCQTF
jgi:hypothetical protein